MKSTSILASLALSSSAVLALEHAAGAHRHGVRAAAPEETATSTRPVRAVHGAATTAPAAAVSSAAAAPTAKPKANAAAASALPLVSYTYAYDQIPYKVRLNNRKMREG